MSANPETKRRTSWQGWLLVWRSYNGFYETFSSKLRPLMALFLPPPLLRPLGFSFSLLFPLQASRSLVPLFSCTARVNDSAFSSLHLNILIELNRFSRRVSTIMEYHCRQTGTRLVVRYNRIILLSIMCTCQSKLYDNQIFKLDSRSLSFIICFKLELVKIGNSVDITW